jgi:hypothetical protein
MSGNEASAIGSMRAISTAQHAYAGKCNGYAPVLTELSIAGNFLSPDMTSGPVLSKSGYTITMTAGAGNLVLPSPAAGCTASGSSYIATAVPMSIGTSGRAGSRRMKAGDLAGCHGRRAVAAVHAGRQRQHHSINKSRLSAVDGPAAGSRARARLAVARARRRITMARQGEP